MAVANSLFCCNLLLLDGPVVHHPTKNDVFQIDDSQFHWLRPWIPGVGAVAMGAFPEQHPSDEVIRQALLDLPVLIACGEGVAGQAWRIDGVLYRRGTLAELTPDQFPRLVLLNFERLLEASWRLAGVNIAAIIRVWRECICAETTFGLYDRHGIQRTSSADGAEVDHAAGVIDARMVSSNTIDQSAITPNSIPILSPTDFGWLFTANRMGHFRRKGGSLGIWSICPVADADAQTKRIEALEVLWEAGDGPAEGFERNGLL